MALEENNAPLTAADVEALRNRFPILSRELYKRPMVYLDNTATTQTPREVVDTIDAMYFTHKANVHRGVHTLSQEATAMQEATRCDVARFIGAASEREVIFTRGTTESINLVASSYGSLLREGDEVILTEMEHHANIVPWQLLRDRRGIVIKVVPINAIGELDMDVFRSLLSERTRIVSVTHVSNVLGTVNPVAEIISEAHRAGAVVLIDGAQAVAHIPVDVRALDADFYVFSSHKMYGPCGVGVLYGKEALLERMPPYQGGGEMIKTVTFAHTEYAELPFKFEAGTPDFVDIAALRTALGFLEEVGVARAGAYEGSLLHYATEGLQKIPSMRIFGTAPGKSAIISFLIGHGHHYDTGLLLDKLGVEVRTGHHCAQPLMAALGITGTVRASFAVYNTFEECDRFIDATRRVAAMLE